MIHKCQNTLSLKGNKAPYIGDTSPDTYKLLLKGQLIHKYSITGSFQDK